MSKGRNILILMGYDYVHALDRFIGDEGCFILITKADTQYIDPKNLLWLGEQIKDRLIISTDPQKEILDIVRNKDIGAMLTLGWRKLIHVPDFDSVPVLLNVHPALLPEYKGYHPVPYVLLNGERSHGITAHWITGEMDAGDIVLRWEIPINTFSTLPSLQHLVNAGMPAFLSELFDKIKSGNLARMPNRDEDTRVRAPRRKPEDSEVFLTDSVEEMFLKVKASDSGRFPAFFVINGEKVYIRLRRDEEAERQTTFDI